MAPQGASPRQSALLQELLMRTMVLLMLREISAAQNPRRIAVMPADAGWLHVRILNIFDVICGLVWAVDSLGYCSIPRAIFHYSTNLQQPTFSVFGLPSSPNQAHITCILRSPHYITPKKFGHFSNQHNKSGGKLHHQLQSDQLITLESHTCR